MRARDLVSVSSPFRAWPRRLVYGVRTRPDVQALKLERRIDVLERIAGLDARVAGWSATFVDVMRPYQVAGMPLVRIGSSFDGGYVLPQRLVRETTGIVSVGVGDNNDADVAIVEARGGTVRVHAWDHTVDGLPTAHPNITFHRTGLGDGPGLLPLDAVVADSFGPDARDLMLLVDAEGAEWDALAAADDAVLDRFSVIAAELHDLGDLLVDPTAKLDVLRRLHRGFVPVAVHANNYTPAWTLPGFVLPDAVEVTYVNRRHVDERALRPGNCPAALLAPCCPDLPDVVLPWVLPPA